METPFGKLSTIDLDDTEVCLKILLEEKHQMLEGLVFEHLFDQILKPDKIEPAFTSVPVIVTIAQRKEKRACAFVWYYEMNDRVERAITRLCAKYLVFPVTYEPQSAEFLTTPKWVKSGQFDEPSAPIHDVLAAWMRTEPKKTTISSSVREKKRQHEALWLYLESIYGSELGTELVLPRIFKNYAIQPFFDGLWDVDRLIEVRKETWFLEVKHKYPYGHPLKFGMNVGQLGVVEGLVNSDIKCLHLVAVKPFWSKEVGIQRILSDTAATEKTLLIGSILDGDKVSEMKSSRPNKSAAHTTFTGRGQLAYHGIPVTSFSPLGFLSSPRQETVGHISRILTGGQKEFVADGDLEKLRLPIPED